jgi:predicted nucleic acid-binding protein
LSFDLATTLRRLKPQRRTNAIARRPDDELTFVSTHVGGGNELLLDTNVYIDVLQARAPDEVKRLIAARVLNHSAIAVSELVHAFGRLDPSHPETKSTLKRLEDIIAAMPRHRLTAPSVPVLVEANILAGMIARLRGLTKSDRQPLLNDAILYLQALEQGQTILTRNVADFDALQQLVPEGRILFYR